MNPWEQLARVRSPVAAPKRRALPKPEPVSAPAEGNLSLAAAMVVTWRGETVAMLQLVPIVFKDFRQ